MTTYFISISSRKSRTSVLRNRERNHAPLFANSIRRYKQGKGVGPDRTSVKKRVDVRQRNATCSKLFRDNVN